MYLTIQAIVLRVTDYNDRDALLTVLSRNHGKLTIKARGLRRKNSPLTAPASFWPLRSLLCLNTRASTPSTKPSPWSCSCPFAGI